MEIKDFELIASLQELPETDPLEIEGIRFGGGTCECVGLLTLLDSVCVGNTC